ncbi:S8 family serine peptidase [Flavobacterium sp. CYK-55]|uniref:S8 family serine peptidase n=1 Tax=Flavobacterium sp. CYK-55 TaxID=2835529 RepID=UPI001BD0CE7C|nr:S8 family serine peptidase [Flavobacterium sp. CYK-55]MBS7785668.1 S8 family serine peptidase [Flavobacterium sp. CYK-55]
MKNSFRLLNALLKKYVVYFFIFSLLFVFEGATAQQNNRYTIQNSLGSFEVQATPSDQFNQLKGSSFAGYYFRLIQFYELPSDEQKKQWEQQGLLLTDYLSANTYFVAISMNFNLASLRRDARAVFEVERVFKLESVLQSKGVPSYSITGTSAQFILSYYRMLDKTQVVSDLQAQGIKVIAQRDYAGQLDVVFPVSKLNQITDLPYVQFIGAMLEPAKAEDNYSYRNTTARSNYLNTGYNGLNYNGAGVVIAIGEDGLLNNLIDIKGRTQEVGTSTTVSDHKLGTAQNAASAGNQDPKNRNNAWGATVLSADGGPNYSSLYSSHNLRFTNHSYGYSISGGYDSSARDHDLRIAALPNHLVSYSSGNSGTEIGYAPYAFAGWGNITGQVKQNKNQVSIGALNSEDVITGFSSRGPMYDGRIIPQMVVEGMEGTSYASPKFVGEIAQLTQAYKALNAGVEPASSLLRAVMMNTADDLGNSGPDHIHGYGRPNLRRAYQTIAQNKYWTTTISNGQNQAQTITVPANAKQIRVMIVWPDAAAAVNANPAIVNNLNLSVKDPANTTYLPWVLDTTPNAINLSNPASRGTDNINTIEQVTVDNPQSGLWTVQISGASVPMGPQRYFVVYEILMNELSMAYPLVNEKFIPGEVYFLRWDSYGESNVFNLAYELNGSGVWNQIVANFDAAKRVYRWIAPQVTGVNTIKFRIQRNGITAYSDVNYIGNTPENFRIIKACADVVTLKWSPVNGATAYKIYRLGAQYMQEVTANITFSGASAELTGQSTTVNEYYAVSALTNASEGQRTIALTKTPGDINCVGFSWTGTVSSDWFNASNWAAGSVPTVNDNVVINSSAPFQPQINAAGALCGSLTIHSGASLTMNNATSYTLSVSGDWQNNGTFNPGIGVVDFNATNSYQEIYGASSTTFYTLKVTKGVVDNILEVNSVIALSSPSVPLNITSGTFKLSSNSTLTPFIVSTSINSGQGLWVNAGTVNFGNYSIFNNAGLIRLSAGTLNFGTAQGNNITYLNNGKFIIEGGTFNITGRISPNSATSSGTYQQSGGTVNVGILGSTSTTRALFEMTANVTFTLTGGTLALVRACSNSTDYSNVANINTVLGGTIQIGNSSTPINQTIRVSTTVPFYNLTVFNNNNPKMQLVNNAIVIQNDLKILGGTLEANNLDINLKGNLTNNGTFTPGTAKVIFNGIFEQSILGSASTTFKGLQINNQSGLLLANSVNTQVDGVLTLTSGVINTGSNTLVLTANGSVSRSSGHVYGLFRKTFSATKLSDTFEIGDALESAYTPLSIGFASVTSTGTITAKTTTGDASSISSSTLLVNKSVNRHWTLTNNGLTFSTYNAVMNYLNNDLDSGADTAQMSGGLYNGSTWSYPTIGTRTSNSTQLTLLTALGTIQLAETCQNTFSTQTVTSCGTYTWPLNANVYSVGGSYQHITPTESGCTHTTTLNLTINSPINFYADADADGYGNPAVNTLACEAPLGYVSNQQDCNDNNANLTLSCTGGVVHMKLFIEGYYMSSGLMNSVKFNQDFVSPITEVEDITIELHHATTYALVETALATLHTNGTLTATFTTAPAGDYYIAVKGANTVQTWSAAPVTIGSSSSVNYDFTTSASKAYAGNMKEVEVGVFAFYTGDISSDDVVDGTDYVLWEGDYNNFAFGIFASDLNGDGVVDGTDYVIWEGSYNNFVFAVYPF